MWLCLISLETQWSESHKSGYVPLQICRSVFWSKSVLTFLWFLIVIFVEHYRIKWNLEVHVFNGSSLFIFTIFSHVWKHTFISTSKPVPLPSLCQIQQYLKHFLLFSCFDYHNYTSFFCHIPNFTLKNIWQIIHNPNIAIIAYLLITWTICPH